MRDVTIAALALLLLLLAPAGALAAPEGQMSWALHFSLAPTLFEPAETPGVVSPFMILYALHDALLKPMPGNPMAPSLAESWTVSPDGLVYDFVLRRGVKFHNGDPVTTDDVKFSFDRYKGGGAKLLKDKVREVQVVDARRVRFHMKQPWPDFMTFYATPATGAAWIVPKKYVERVGDDGYKKAPIGAGPYRFVSFTPGVELVFEAFDQYWRKAPNVKRLHMKGVPDPTTRAAMLKSGEADIAYALDGQDAENVRRDPRLQIVPSKHASITWLEFADQWDPKSPWHDRRVRLAAALAVDKQTLNEAERMGRSRLTGNIIPSSLDFALRIEPYPYDPTHAKRLLADAGYPNGFDAGDYYCDSSYANLAEAVLNNFQEAGIRVKLRPLERAAFFAAYSEKKLKNIIQGSSGAFGNAATRLDAFAAKGGAYVYGSYPEIDELFAGQAAELPHPHQDGGRRRRKGANGEDGYSGFTMRDPVSGEQKPTELEGLLRERDIDKAVVCGLATDYCVSATAIDAANLGFDTEVLQDAIAAVNLKPGDGQAAIGAMSAAGCTLGYCFGTLP